MNSEIFAHSRVQIFDTVCDIYSECDWLIKHPLIPLSMFVSSWCDMAITE